MHFAIHKLPPSSHPYHSRLLVLYLSYTAGLIFLQLYLLFAMIYHGRRLGYDFDPTFPFHIFLTWVTSIGNIGRFIEHIKARDFDEYMKSVREMSTVGRFDGVFAVLWVLPYIMLPFALFGDFSYDGATWAIPIPMIIGFTMLRIVYGRINATYHTGEYAKVATDEEDFINEELPAYEEHDSREGSPAPPHSRVGLLAGARESDNAEQQGEDTPATA